MRSSLLPQHRYFDRLTGMLMRLILFMVVLPLVTRLAAQDPTLAPELRAALTKDLADTARAQILVKLCFNLTRSQPDSAKIYGEQGLALAERIGHTKSIADAHNNLGWLAVNQGDLSRGDTELTKALELFQGLGVPKYVSVVRSNLGWLAEMKGDRVGALKQFQEALQLSEAAKDSGNTAVLLYNIGTTYNKMNEFGRARKLFQQSLDQEQLLDRPEKQANCHMGIANTYRSEGDPAKALTYYDRAEKLYARIGDHGGAGLVAENAGALFEEKDPNKALAYYQQALAQYDLIDSPIDKAYVLLSIGGLQSSMGRLAKADSSLNAGIHLAATSHASELVMEYEKRLAELASAAGDSKATLTHYARYVALKDSLRSVDSENELLRLRTSFETERAEKDNEILRATDREKTERLHRREVELYGSIVLGLLILAAALLLYRNFRHKQQNEKILARLNGLLELRVLRAQMDPHFIHNCLNAIKGLSLSGEHEKAEEYLDGFARLLRTVLEHSVRDRIALEEEIDFLRDYVKLEELRLQGGLTWSITADESLLDEGAMIPSLLVQPFVENAIWHGLAPKEGTKQLTVHFSPSDRGVQCIIEDNGVGRDAAHSAKADPDRRSRGLQLTGERLQLLTEHLKGKGDVQIEDLKDDAGQALGTRVMLNLRDAMG